MNTPNWRLVFELYFLERLGYSQNSQEVLDKLSLSFVINLIIGLSPYWEGEITPVGGLDVDLLTANYDKNTFIFVLSLLFEFLDY